MNQNLFVAVNRKDMKSIDLRFDVLVVRGLCELIKPELPIPAIVNEQNELESIEANIAALQEEVLTPNHKIGPIERLYDLRTGMRQKNKINESNRLYKY